MRSVVQRVSQAVVRLAQPPLPVEAPIAQPVLGRIDRGLLVLLGIGHGDTMEDLAWMVDKIAGLRIFPDPPGEGAEDRGNLNLALRQVGGALLIVSQFTLYGDCRKGRRPSFTEAMAPGPAEALYNQFLAMAKQAGLSVSAGRFGAMMEVELCNDGPVTLWLDSRAPR